MTITNEQILELAGIFDDIITSDSDAVKSAFQRLAFLSALARVERDDPGPFTDIVNRLDWMEREMVEMRREIQILQNTITPNDLLRDASVDLGPFIKSLNSSGTPVTMGTITIPPLTGTDVITLSSSQTDIFTSNIRIDLDGTTQ
jgi:hypothetical protein